MERPHYTQPVSKLTRADCEALIRLALAEDAPAGDVTSESIFPATRLGRALLSSREAGVLCGLPVVETLLELDGQSNPAVTLRSELNDGAVLTPGIRIATLEGPLATLLRLERVILNFLQYLSGISTTVADAVRRAGPRIFVLDTRKTLPGYRRLAKYAVYCGGGVNHRISLSEMAMLKDNHVAAAGGIAKAAALIQVQHPTIPLEIEIDRPDQLDEALGCRPRVLLLDNMRGHVLAEVLQTIAKIPDSSRPFVELSGGWTPDDLAALDLPLQVGVSMGYLTHTTRFLDLSLDVE